MIKARRRGTLEIVDVMTAVRAPSPRSAVVRIAGWSARRPRQVIAGWVVLLVACLAVGALVGTNRAVTMDFWVGEAGRAEAIAAAGGLTPAPVERVVLTGSGGPLDPAAADAAARDVAERLAALPDVASVSDVVLAADGSAARIDVTLSGDSAAAKAAVPVLLERLTMAQAAHPDLAIALTGDASVGVGVDAQLGRDLARVEAISLPLTFLILLLVFGAVLAAGIPVVLALSAVTGSIGLYGLASWIFPDVGGAVLSVIFLLGMAVGVDYSLFYLKRVREERVHPGTHTAAVERAAATAGRSIWVAGTAVIVSLAGLYLVDDVIFSSIATGAILVVAVAMASSLTVLPALLVALGRRVDGRGDRAPGAATARWARLLRPALRRPVATALVGVSLAAALAWPATSMRLGVEGTETFPAAVPAVGAHERVVRAFPAERGTHLVSVRADPARTSQVMAAMRDLAGRTRGDALFAQDAVPEIRTSADGTTGTVAIAIPYGANSPQALTSLALLRTELVPATVGSIPGADVAVTGDVARGVDYAAHQAGRIPWVIGAVSVATLVVMAVAFGSLVLALLGAVLNLLAVACAWGALTLVFQHSWAEGLFGFTSTGFLGSRTPLLVFAILVGLSTDYQVFVVGRIREAVLDGMPTRDAVRHGITGSAGVVTSAAVIMVSIFVGFMLIDRIEMKQIGLGLTVGVVVDAVVLRILILPAVMTLLDRHCWWPARAPLHRPTTRAHRRDASMISTSVPPTVRLSTGLWLAAIGLGAAEAVVRLALPGPSTGAELAVRFGIYAALAALVAGLLSGHNVVRWVVALLLGGVGTVSLVVEPFAWLLLGGSPADFLAAADGPTLLVVALRLAHLGAVLAALVLMFRPASTTFFRSRGRPRATAMIYP